MNTTLGGAHSSHAGYTASFWYLSLGIFPGLSFPGFYREAAGGAQAPNNIAQWFMKAPKPLHHHTVIIYITSIPPSIHFLYPLIHPAAIPEAAGAMLRVPRIAHTNPFQGTHTLLIEHEVPNSIETYPTMIK